MDGTLLGILLGTIGTLGGSIVAYFASMRVKSGLNRDAHSSYKDIVKMKDKTISMMRGKLSNMQRVDVRGVDIGGDKPFAELLDALLDAVPASWKPVLQPALQTGVEKWNTDPAFQEKVKGALNNFIKKGGAEGIIKGPAAEEDVGL